MTPRRDPETGIVLLAIVVIITVAVLAAAAWWVVVTFPGLVAGLFAAMGFVFALACVRERVSQAYDRDGPEPF